jgi:hypothetical protein
VKRKISRNIGKGKTSKEASEEWRWEEEKRNTGRGQHNNVTSPETAL